MKRKETDKIILDAAEKLFGTHGYHSTSLRAITKSANVNLAAVNYHFGSKEELMIAVINRRLIPLNDRRLEELGAIVEQAGATDTKPKVSDMLHAFIQPIMKLSATTPGAKSFFTLIGRALAEPDDTVRKVFVSQMEPVLQLMMQGLSLALPDIPREILFWRLHFVIGAVSHTLRCMGNCPIRLEGVGQVKDPDTLVDMLVAFVTAGMEDPY